jgi:hypothetical protein
MKMDAAKLLKMPLISLALTASVTTTLTSSCAQDPFPVTRVYRVDAKFLECDQCDLDAKTGNVSNCKPLSFSSCGAMAAVKVSDVPLIRSWINRQLERCEGLK